MSGQVEQIAPELEVQEWLNGDPILLSQCRGRVVVVYAFQMLCPGCVHHATPQISRLHEMFSKSDDAVVIGLHTVFEHHDVMGPEALKVYIHENRLNFPVAVDRPTAGSRIPRTMATYELQGTPTIVLIDRHGQFRAKYLGPVEDMSLGVAIGRLLAET